MFVKGSHATQADLELSTQLTDEGLERLTLLLLVLGFWDYRSIPPWQSDATVLEIQPWAPGDARQACTSWASPPAWVLLTNLHSAPEPQEANYQSNVERLANKVERERGDGGRTGRPKWGHFWHIIRNDAHTPSLHRNLIMISIWERAKCSNN